MRVFNEIGCIRLSNIQVMLNGKEIIYDGEVDNAPDDIKKLKYSEIEMSGTTIKLNVYEK